ncbi:hypothetical protein [Pseudomonas sp. 4810-S13]|uniref:hypothetical protein n=1 Tax=Pseudomonas sp. 4810-S13 TaxID=3120822 RepID=UPI001039D407
MKSSELRRWLEQQEALHGDRDVACMTAFGNVAEGDSLTVEQLGVTTPRMLPMRLDGIEDSAKVIAIGCGNQF